MTPAEKILLLSLFGVSVTLDTLNVLSEKDCKAIIRIIRKAEKRNGVGVVIVKKPVPITMNDDGELIQHVGYTDEQCGREK